MSTLPTVAEIVGIAVTNIDFLEEIGGATTHFDVLRAAQAATDVAAESWEAKAGVQIGSTVTRATRGEAVAALMEQCRMSEEAAAERADDERADALADAIEAGDVTLDDDGDPRSVPYDTYRSA